MSEDDPFLAITRRGLVAGASVLAGGVAAGLGPPVWAAEPSAKVPASSDAAPWVYWYWISQNISRDGITRDLEAMARVGIGEALIGIIHDKGYAGEVRTLGADWWEMVVHAVREGRRTGVRVGFFNGPGWSQSGGPWVKPEQSMRYIASRETRVAGGQRIELRLPPPGDDFQPVSTLAFPAPRDEGDRIGIDRIDRIETVPPLPAPERLVDGNPLDGCVLPAAVVSAVSTFEDDAGLARRPEGVRQTIDFVLKAPVAVQSLTLTVLPVPFYATAELLCEGADGGWSSIRHFPVDRRTEKFPVGPMIYGPVAIAFAPVTSRRFRLVLSRVGGGAGCGLADVRLSSAPVIERFVEKQLGKLHNSTEPEWDTYRWPATPEPAPGYAIDPATIVDLTAATDADGVLRWDAPPGDWIVLRSGMLPTRVTNSPAPPAATGLEVDKLSTRAVAAHFDAYVGDLLHRLDTAGARGWLSRVVIDSYEAGPQNWTDDFAEVFQARFGYDPRPWLVTLTGRIVGSADRSERFLWDLRRLVADLVAERYVGTLADESRRHGLGLWCENYGHWGFPSEFLAYAGHADRVAGEYWVGRDGKRDGPGEIETRAAVSGAHIYGKRIVSAESFTSAVAWSNTPASLKRIGDWAFSRGINHAVLHVYIHQPWEDRKPGVNAWFGTEFNRHNIWFGESASWITYLTRCSARLQQGWQVAEVALFIGEETPVMAGPPAPPLPFGHKSFDINADAILNRLSVQAGRFRLKDGPDFAVLVLPPAETMRPEVLRRLADLVAAGGTICGAAPRRSPSLANYPHADAELARQAARLWPGGRAARGVFARTALLAALRHAQAKVSISGVDAPDLLWSHRRTDHGDVYFLSNQGKETLTIAPSLLARPGAVTVVDAVSGVATPAIGAVRAGDRVTVPLGLPSGGSLFVMIDVDPPATRPTASTMPGRTAAPLLASPAPRGGARWQTVPIEVARWTVHFPGLDRAERRFDQLVNWAASDDPTLRFFSGTATYEAVFDLDAGMIAAGGLAIDLGQVGTLAEVIVNGQSCGTAWCAPYVLDITAAARPGPNRLQVRVTNGWYNRLVGDAAHPEGIAGMAGRPFLTADFDLGDKVLQSSGLIGPVALWSIV